MSYTQDVIAKVQRLYPDQVEFHQAVKEVLESIEPALQKIKDMKIQSFRANRNSRKANQFPCNLGR